MKGQVALEFVTFSAIFLLFLIGVLVLINIYGGQEIRSTNYLLASELSNRVSQAITTTASMGKGFSYTLGLPVRLGNSDYSITLVNATNGQSSRVFIELPFNNEASNTFFSYVNCENAVTDSTGRTICKLEPGKSYSLTVEEGHVYIREVSP